MKEDPMLGLAANYIPANLLNAFVTALQRNAYKKRYSRHGFVIEASSHGNETKFMTILDDFLPEKVVQYRSQTLTQYWYWILSVNYQQSLSLRKVVPWGRVKSL